MKVYTSSTFIYILARFFIPSSLLSLVLTSMTLDHIPQTLSFGKTKTDLSFLLPFAMVIALAAAAITIGIFLLNRRRIKKGGHRIMIFPLDHQHLRKVAVAMFLCAFSTTMLMAYETGLLILAICTTLLAVLHVKHFAGLAFTILKPGRHATWNEAGQLILTYATLLMAFTILNAGIEVLYHLQTPPQAPFTFGHGRELVGNAFYFTVVTMTTLGYGDFTPTTLDTRVLTAIECLTGYVMFALLVGVITKGISDKNAPDQQHRDHRP